MAKLFRIKRKINRSFGGTVVLFVFIFLGALLMSLPLVLVISNSLKPLNELWVFPPRLFPKNPTLQNYRDMMLVLSNTLVPVSRYLFNTVFVTVAGTVGNIFLASLAAYPLAKRNFPGKNLLFQMVVLSLMFNATVTAIPNYLVVESLGWIDTYAALIVPATASSLGLYLMKQFMEQIPDAMIEAATIDGANQPRIFMSIVMPNVKPAWLTLILLSVQSLWSMGETSFVFSEPLKTLSYALGQIMAGGLARAGVGTAVAVVMMGVPIFIFILTQSNIIETMSTSGMKD